MAETMGQIIRRLRKELNLTQEELAEQLNISAPAISKWENETAMPDIMQVVPIAKVFGISTDVLFGTLGENDDHEAMEIIQKAQEKTYIDGRSTTKSLYEGYMTVQEGIKRYPSNMLLLTFSLERGMALTYPENDCYDIEHANSIYKESIRQANIVITYGTNVADILRAHMIMVMMHSVYGNIDQAVKHSYQFPCRADMTINNMSAYISHAEHNYTREVENRQYEFTYLLEAMLDNTASCGRALYQCERYADAITVYTIALSLINTVFRDKGYIPPVHERDCGDLYVLLAESYIKTGENNNALLQLEKMVDYCLETWAYSAKDMQGDIPLSHHMPYINFNTNVSNTISYKDHLEILMSKLQNSAFDCLKNNEKYINMVIHISEEIRNN